jgi:phage shock protein PspC (stress-responsive transcriptional regulator)
MVGAPSEAHHGSMNTATDDNPPPPPPPAAPPRVQRRYVRREEGKWLAGVCTGMSDAFGIDVTVISVLWVIVALGSFGVGVAAYALFWFAFPSEEHPAPISRFAQMREWNSGYVIGLVLIGIGAIVVFGWLMSVQPYHHFGAFAWATLLIGGGAAILLLRNPDDRDDTEPAPPVPPGATGYDAPPEPIAAGDAAPTAPAFPQSPTSAQTTSAQTTSAQTTSAQTTSAWTQHAPWPAPPPRPPRPKRRRPRPFLTPLTLSVLLIGGGVVALLNEADVTDVTTAQALAGAVCVIGIALLVSTRFGRARGLIPVGILLLLATIPASVIDVPITGGVGDRTYRPTTVSEVDAKYQLGIGELDLDLRDLALGDETVDIAAQVGIGRLDIHVPSTATVEVRAHAGVGALSLFSNTYDDWPLDQTVTAPGTRTGTGVIVIDAKVGAGQVQVSRYDVNGVEVPFPRSIR